MKLTGVTLSIFMLGSILPCQSLVTLAHAQQRPQSTGSRSEQAVINHLRPVLGSIGKGARIDYRGACSTGIGDQVAFPEIETDPPTKRKTGLVAIREIFRNDKDVIVTAGHAGLVRIKIGRVSDKILQAKIPTLTLTPLEQYDPAWTIYAIENTTEIKSAARKLRVRPVSFSPGLANIITPPGSPHLPPSLKNVTVEQVLDLTAKTFKSIVIYGICTQQNGQDIFRLDFVDIRGGASSGMAGGPR